MQALPDPPQPSSAPTNTPPNPPSPTPAETSTPAPKISSRKLWTATEVDYLCCLKLHTHLSYGEINHLIQQQLGGARVNNDVVRYKLNVLSCRLPPTQRGRRVRSLAVDPRWLYFSALEASALEVQRVLRHCGITGMWAGQLVEDYLCVLMMHGDVLDGEVARRVNKVFGCELEAEQIKRWYDAVQGLADGSWGWFNGKADDDVEVRAILSHCGL